MAVAVAWPSVLASVLGAQESPSRTGARLTVPAQSTSTITVPITLTANPRAVTFDGDVSLLGVLRQ